MDGGRAGVAGGAFVGPISGRERGVIRVIGGEGESAGDRVGIEIAVPRSLAIGRPRGRGGVPVTHGYRVFWKLPFFLAKNVEVSSNQSQSLSFREVQNKLNMHGNFFS